MLKHESLTVVGAQELLEETTALSWLTCGAAIQHIADVIRLLAVDTHGGGWMLDGDELWLRPWPDAFAIWPRFPQHAC